MKHQYGVNLNESVSNINTAAKSSIMKNNEMKIIGSNESQRKQIMKAAWHGVKTHQ
jgi:hypothetical protein